MKEHTENRWAIWNYEDDHLCGRFCWNHGQNFFNLNLHGVPTFRTRKLARVAIERMTSYRYESRPVRVTVTIAITGD